MRNNGKEQENKGFVSIFLLFSMYGNIKCVQLGLNLQYEVVIVISSFRHGFEFYVYALKVTILLLNVVICWLFSWLKV